jgi:hypothetical protein
MTWFEDFTVDRIPQGATICIGVVAEHDSEYAEAILDTLQAWLMAYKGMPLLVQGTQSDCFITPPERGNKHVEMRVIRV